MSSADCLGTWGESPMLPPLKRLSVAIGLLGWSSAGQLQTVPPGSEGLSMPNTPPQLMRFISAAIDCRISTQRAQHEYTTPLASPSRGEHRETGAVDTNSRSASGAIMELPTSER